MRAFVNSSYAEYLNEYPDATDSCRTWFSAVRRFIRNEDEIFEKRHFGAFGVKKDVSQSRFFLLSISKSTECARFVISLTDGAFQAEVF